MGFASIGAIYSRGLLWLGGLTLIAMMVHVTADIIAKYVAGQPLVGTLEVVSSYYMVGCVFLPLVAVERARGQIFVDFFTSWMSPRAQAAVDVLACALTAAFVLTVAWQSGVEALIQTEYRETTASNVARFEIWPARWFPVLAFAGMFGYLVWHGIEHARFALTGRRNIESAAS